MKLTRLIIENYRNFENLDLEISNMNVVFGVNDIGKTNLLSAIRMLLDPQCRRNSFFRHKLYQMNMSIEMNMEIS